MVLRVLSLGWGIQSTTLAAMSALGYIERFDHIVHADTTHESVHTYDYAAKWTPWYGERGIDIVTVQGSRTSVVEPFDKGPAVMIPAFTTSLEGKPGQIRRQCTHDWKIAPIRKFIRTQIGNPQPGDVELVQGISFDEWMRQRSSDVKYIVNSYPLVEQRITRAACVQWLESHSIEVPPKSACTFCPFHSVGLWKQMKRDGGPDWDHALAVDAAIREKRPSFSLYIHPNRLPLADAVRIPEDHGASQLELDMPCDGGSCWI